MDEEERKESTMHILLEVLLQRRYLILISGLIVAALLASYAIKAWTKGSVEKRPLMHCVLGQIRAQQVMCFGHVCVTHVETSHAGFDPVHIYGIGVAISATEEDQ